MQIDPITAALGSTAASTTSVNGVNNFESYLNNAGNNFRKPPIPMVSLFLF